MMLTSLLFLGAIVAGLYFLWRGRKAFPDANPVNSIGDLYTFSRSGTVTNQQGRTETTISAYTTGGSTLLSDGVGAVSHPTTSIESSTVEVIRMFLRDDAEREFEVEVDDLGFGVVPGHRVTVLYAGSQASQRGHPMGVANHTTGRSAVLPHRVEWLIRRRSTSLGCMALAVIPFFTMLIATVIIGLFQGLDPRGHSVSGTTFGAFAFLAVGAWLLRGRMRSERLKRDVIATLERELAQAR